MSFSSKDLPLLNCKKFFVNLFQTMHNLTSRFILFLQKYLFCSCCCCCSKLVDNSSQSEVMGAKISKKPSSRENLSTNLSEHEIDLLLISTKMSRQEIVDFHYNYLKECPSGFLTKKEFITMFKLLHPSDTKKQKVEKFCQYVFK
jgi:hypothetical protein